MWMPAAGLRGIFQMTFFEHVTILHGVGVGGGSLVYANTLPTPKKPFFRAASWAHLADWESELAPFYATAKRMLGATPYPGVTRGDEIVREIARDLGRESHHHPTEVAVFFGEPGKRVADPYFDDKGPDRVGCTHCGACMTGCRVGAKNTLDRNYLYLAERLGVLVKAETEVKHVAPLPGGGYRVRAEPSITGGRAEDLVATNVIFAGGVMGTIPLLLSLKEDPTGLPKLSDRVGDFVRTNSEALFGVVAPDEDDLTKGVAITSILHTDEHSHLEPVRYGRGSGFFRLMLSPHAPGETTFGRLLLAGRELLGEPKKWLRTLLLSDFSRHSQVLLYLILIWCCNPS
jgi:cholesterol oxidase